MPSHLHLDVRDAADRHRYEAVTGDGTVAGFVRYRRHGDVVDLVHTEVDDAFAGQGVGTRLVRSTLDGLRQRGLLVVATCPFVAAYLQRHPDYADLVASDDGDPSDR